MEVTTKDYNIQRIKNDNISYPMTLLCETMWGWPSQHFLYDGKGRSLFMLQCRKAWNKGKLIFPNLYFHLLMLAQRTKWKFMFPFTFKQKEANSWKKKGKKFDTAIFFSNSHLENQAEQSVLPLENQRKWQKLGPPRCIRMCANHACTEK